MNKNTIILGCLVLILAGLGTWKFLCSKCADACPEGDTCTDHAAGAADSHAAEAEDTHAEGAADAHVAELKVELSPEQAKTVGLTRVRVEKRPLAEVLELPGAIPEEPAGLISVMPSESCVVTSVRVAVGERVSRGSILAIGKTDAGDPVTMTAPLGGTVLALTRRAGESADTFSPAVLLADLSSLTLSLSATVEDAANLRVGQKVEAFHPSTRSDLHRGWITTISPRVDPETRLVRIAAKVDNSNGHLRLGMFLSARVHVESGKAVLSVPEGAVLRVNGADTAYLQDGEDPDAFVPTVVTTGERRGGRVAILSGLKEGDRVAGAGTFYLKSAQLRGAMTGCDHGH
jgi:hypothetical protein